MTATAIVALLCLAEVCTMIGVATWPALLPGRQAEWHIGNTMAGTISGAFFAGYMAAVPVLVSLTDRWRARDVYVGSCLILTAGSLALARAEGPALAMAGQALLGAGLAGTYMPGLKELSDRITGPRQPRAIAFYTSTYGVGNSLSLWIAGTTQVSHGWRAAFAVAALGPIAAAALIAVALPAQPFTPSTVAHAGLFRSILRVPRIRHYILTYAAHCCELFAVRSWMVAF